MAIDESKYKNGVYELIKKEAEKRWLNKELIEEKIKDKKLEKKMASTGQRFLNFIIDIFACYAISIFFAVVLISTGIIDKNTPDDTLESWLVWILSLFTYYFICELKFQRTLGKLVTKTKVIVLDGKKPTTSQILGRTLARFIPFEVLSGFLSQRFHTWYGWHDSLSGTMVVSLKHFSEENK